MEGVEEMPRPNLVDRGEEQILLARDECVLRRLVPRRIGRRDIIDRRQAFLIRPRNIDIGAVLPVIRRRFLDLRLFRAGTAHDILLDQKSAEYRSLATRPAHRAALTLVRTPQERRDAK